MPENKGVSPEQKTKVDNQSQISEQTIPSENKTQKTPVSPSRNNSGTTNASVEMPAQESSQHVTGNTLLPPPPPPADGNANKSVGFNKGLKSTPSVGDKSVSSINNSGTTNASVETPAQKSSQHVTGNTLPPPPPPPELNLNSQPSAGSVPPPPPPPPADGNANKSVGLEGSKSTPSMSGDLLSEIRKGVTLKKVNNDVINLNNQIENNTNKIGICRFNVKSNKEKVKQTLGVIKNLYCDKSKGEKLDPGMVTWIKEFIEDNELGVDVSALSKEDIKVLYNAIREGYNLQKKYKDLPELNQADSKQPTQVGAGTTGESSNINPQVTNQPNPVPSTNNSDATKVPVEKSGQESSQKVTGSTPPPPQPSAGGVPPPPPLLSPSAGGSASKAVEFNKGPKSTPSMGGDLLSDIRKGKNLKSVAKEETSKPVEQEKNELFNQMKKMEAMRGDDDVDESEEEEDWDD